MHAYSPLHVIYTALQGDSFLANFIDGSPSCQLFFKILSRSLWNRLETFGGQLIKQGCFARTGCPRYHMSVRLDPERS
jgi:hypothetical protein